MEYPHQRDWNISSINIMNYPPIQKNWDHSKVKISEIRSFLKSKTLPDEVSTIVAAGSLARMEASPDVSDADLIIVLKDDIDLKIENSKAKAKEIHEAVWTILKPLNLEKPKPTGIFSEPTNCNELKSDVGDANEPYSVFGKRLLLLLESQPLWNDEEYISLIEQIVDRYAFKIC